MSESQPNRTMYENRVFDMFARSMLVVTEKDAAELLGTDMLVQLMVDRLDGVGPTFLCSDDDPSVRYYFLNDLLLWNKSRH